MRYKVLNPIIIGKFNSEYNAETALDAVKEFWSKLSDKIINNIPQMGVTLEDSNGKLHHFKILEDMTSSKVIDFKIAPLYLTLPENATQSLKQKYKDLKSSKTLHGGARSHRYDTDDSPSDDEKSDELVDKFEKLHALKRNQPIVYYYYNPSIYRLDSLYIPVFAYPIAPYIEMGFSSAFWG